jgi:hypothetical protein
VYTSFTFRFENVLCIKNNLLVRVWEEAILAAAPASEVEVCQVRTAHQVLAHRLHHLHNRQPKVTRCLQNSKDQKWLTIPDKINNTPYNYKRSTFILLKVFLIFSTNEKIISTSLSKFSELPLWNWAQLAYFVLRNRITCRQLTYVQVLQELCHCQ